MKEWFKARNLWGAAINALDDDEAGRLMKAIWAYTMDGVQTELTGRERGVFALIMMTLSMDEEKDAEISEKRAAAGSKGGKQKVANATGNVAKEANEANAYKNKNKDIDKDTKKEIYKEKRFTPPTLQEVADYCKERNNNVNPELFIDFYTSKGWKVGNQPMKDWKSAVRTWERNRNDSRPTNTVVAQQYSQRDYTEVERSLEDAQRRKILERLGGETSV